jgi:hypothetical protein
MTISGACRVQIAVIALATALAWQVIASRDEESLALVVVKLAGLVSGTVFSLWMLGNERLSADEQRRGAG